jgi:biopolymer transport protein ExbD
MPKVKLPKGSPSLDMTPMVDLGFLLVTFFILTAKFRPTEPVQVTIPASHSEIILPEKTLLVTIDKDGRVFFDLSGKEVRAEMLRRVVSRYGNVKLTEDQVNRFAVMATFGQPLERIGQYLDGDEKKRAQMDAMPDAGIPCDSLNNQLKDWILDGYASYINDAIAHGISEEELRKNDKLRLSYAIKADGDTDYDKVQKVINVFRDQQIFQFNMITSLESEAPAVN